MKDCIVSLFRAMVVTSFFKRSMYCVAIVLVVGFLFLMSLKLDVISSNFDSLLSFLGFNFNSSSIKNLFSYYGFYVFCGVIFVFSVAFSMALLEVFVVRFVKGFKIVIEDYADFFEWLTWVGLAVIGFSLSVPKLFDVFNIYWFYAFVFGSLLLFIKIAQELVVSVDLIKSKTGSLSYFRFFFLLPFLFFVHRQALFTVNDFFGVDASDMPFSVILMSIYWVCLIFYLPMIVWFSCSIVKAINSVDKVGKDSGVTLHDVAYTFLLPYITFLLVSTFCLEAPKLLIQVAEFADFSDKNRCFPNEISTSVLFSSSLGGYVLVKKDEKSFEPKVRYGLEKCVP